MIKQRKYILVGGIVLGLAVVAVGIGLVEDHPNCAYTAKPSPVDAGADDTAGPGAADGESTG